MRQTHALRRGARGGLPVTPKPGRLGPARRSLEDLLRALERRHSALALALIVGLVCCAAPGTAGPAPSSARQTGAVDGLWYWRLPDTPNGLRPNQSWSGAGLAPNGDVYVGGMDHETNAALYRLRHGRLRYVGDARAASEAAGNWLDRRGRREVPHPAHLARRPGLRRDPEQRRPQRGLSVQARLQVVRLPAGARALQGPQRRRARRQRPAARRPDHPGDRSGRRADLRRRAPDRRARALRHRRRGDRARRPARLWPPLRLSGPLHVGRQRRAALVHRRQRRGRVLRRALRSRRLQPRALLRSGDRLRRDGGLGAARPACDRQRPVLPRGRRVLSQRQRRPRLPLRRGRAVAGTISAAPARSGPRSTSSPGCST